MKIQKKACNLPSTHDPFSAEMTLVIEQNQLIFRMNNEQVQLHTLVAKLPGESEITKLMISWTLKVVSFTKFSNI